MKPIIRKIYNFTPNTTKQNNPTGAACRRANLPSIYNSQHRCRYINKTSLQAGTMDNPNQK